MPIQPGSYITPHRHPHGEESVVVLFGSMRAVIFGNEWEPIETYELSPLRVPATLIPRGTYHTFISTAPDSAMFESFSGEFDESTYKEFAPWAPPENLEEPRAQIAYLKHLTKKTMA